MDELLVFLQSKGLEFFLDEVLNSLDIVVGGSLNLCDSKGVVVAETCCNGAYAFFLFKGSVKLRNAKPAK